MKILIVCSKNFGYISPFIIEQANALIKLGIEVEYSPIVGKGILGYLKNYYSLLKKIRSFKPDLVHAHYGLSGALAVLQRKVPVVITFHNGETLSKSANFISSLSSLLAEHTIYVAQHIYDLCYFKKKKAYSILACGVDVDNIKVINKETGILESKLNNQKKYIIFGGSFNNLRKNYPLLQDALSLLKRNDIEVIEMKGLNRAQITNLMCACDLFILPTKSEGSPQALKEAMACNCPIVATDVADIKHLLGDLEGCYITSFDPKDVSESITKALEFDKRTEGRKRIFELGLDSKTVALKILEIYKSLQ